MPQIWLTYEEFGEAFRLSPGEARNLAIESGYSRRRCSDGLTRVKLTPVLLADFLKKCVLQAMERRDVTIDLRATEAHWSDVAGDMRKDAMALAPPCGRNTIRLR